MTYDIYAFIEGYAIFRVSKRGMVFIAVFPDHITAEGVCRDLRASQVTHRPLRAK